MASTDISKNLQQQDDDVYDDNEDDIDEIEDCPDSVGSKLKACLNINDLTEGTEFEIVPSVTEDEVPYSDQVKKEYFGNGNNLIAQGEDSDEEENSDLTPFERIERKMHDISDGENGVMKMVLKEGAGARVPDGAFVRVHYNGFLEYSDEPYDSSRLRDCPEKFTVGESEVIPGWEIAVKTMKKGELSRFLIKSDYSYGPRGCPPRIPPAAAILFEIEVLSFMDRSGVDSFFNKNRRDRLETPFSDVMRAVRAEEEMAKDQWKRQKYNKALVRYQRIVTRALEEARLENAEDETIQQKHLHKNYLNLARCALRQGEYERARSNCRKALDIKRDAPTLFLMGKSLRVTSEFARARKFLQDAQKLKPSSSEINKELSVLNENVKSFNANERDFWRRAFSGGTDDATETIETKGSELLTSRPDSEFRRLIEDKLIDFKNDEEKTDLPFFGGSMSVQEMAIIGETAKKLGISVVHRGEGTNLEIKFSKNSEA
ncbi:inactive peptidyl-prolyl cis-trans isomerase FKBP6-like [Tubulanus polymorphus]|uniref:inactive peptidyl-prolyl cis-trans isomerase FKBP6-like n=1 Tax=Tubulanus polymorphus TaxID=672921 RepID=UPI003DA1EC36